MHDSEPDTFVLKTYPQRFSEFLSKIGIESTPKEIGDESLEQRYQVQNHACLMLNYPSNKD